MAVSATLRAGDRVKRMRQAIQIKRRQINMDDTDYRAMLQRVAGVASSTDVFDERVLFKIQNELNRLGAPAGPARRPLTQPQKKMWSLWQQLADAGRVRDRRMPALLSWVKRQAHVDALGFLSSAQEYALIEALKSWLERKDGDTDDARGKDHPNG